MPGRKRKRTWGNARRSVKRRLVFRAFRLRNMRRRKFRRRRPRLRSRRAFARAFPYTLLRKHKYATDYTISASTAVAFHQNAVNDMYDPNYTGVGHQPYQRDEMAALYKYYEVLFCTVATTVMPLEDNPVACYVGQVTHNINDSMPSSSSEDAWKEHPRSNWKLVPQGTYDNAVDPQTYFPLRTRKLYKKCTPRRWLLDKQAPATAVGSSPTERVLHTLWCYPIDEASTITVKVIQTLIFYVKWTRPVISAVTS